MLLWGVPKRGRMVGGEEFGQMEVRLLSETLSQSWGPLNYSDEDIWGTIGRRDPEGPSA